MGSREGTLKVAAKRIGMTVEAYQERLDRGEKWCHSCRRWLARDAFSQDRSRSDGLAARCKTCASPRTTSGPSKPERIAKRAEGQAWCRHCEAWLPIGEVRAGLCREHRNADERRRYRDNPAFREKRGRRSYLRKRKVDQVPAIGQEVILEAFEGKCAYCGEPATTWDHIEPVSRNGQTVPWNIVPACVPCNSSKNARDLRDWLLLRGERVSLDVLDRIMLEHCGLFG